MVILFVSLTIATFVCIYRYGVRNYGYWSKRNIKHLPPIPYLGNCLDFYTQRKNFTRVVTDLYNQFPSEKVVGFYNGTVPTLLLRDPDIIKRILVTDFKHFHDRGLMPEVGVQEPILRNLFSAEGDLWRLLRQCLSPAFTPGKIKTMFRQITKSAEKLQELTEKVSENGKETDIKNLLGSYTEDFIANCGFGINTDAFSKENSEFKKLGGRLVQRTPADGLRTAIKYFFPYVSQNITYIAPDVVKSITNLVNNVMKERGYKSSNRNDFVDYMMKLKENGLIVGKSIELTNPDGSEKSVELVFDDLMVASHSFVFFIAGYETTMTSASYTLHYLAFDPECQRKAQEEIDQVLARYNGKITYEAVQEMIYVKMAVEEASRLSPSLGSLNRKCNSKEYTIPEIGLTIDEGVKIVIPNRALQNDGKYFPNPEVFDPERFHPDLKLKRHKFVFLPFGEGPRVCVGKKMGQMVAIAGVAAILHKYSVEPTCNSLRTPVEDPSSLVIDSILGSLSLQIKKRLSAS